MALPGYPTGRQGSCLLNQLVVDLFYYPVLILSLRVCFCVFSLHYLYHKLNTMENLHTISVSSLLFFALNILLVTCQREAYDPLPPTTQEGKGTIGCRINGEVWLPYSNDFKSTSKTARYLEKEKTLFIGGFDDQSSQGLFLGLTNYSGQTGTYELDSICTDLPNVCANTGGYSTSKYLEKLVTYQTSSQFRGKAVITKHTSNGIVSGTFEFEAKNRATGKVIKITDGRFDLNVRTQ